MATSNTKRIRVAIFGAGRMGTYHAQNIDQNIEYATIAVIVDVDRNAAERLSKSLKNSSNINIFTDYHAALENQHSNDIDCIVIAVTTMATDRSQIAIAALNKKIPVFIEKPLASTLEEGLKIREAVLANKTLFQIGFMRRFDTDLHELCSLSADNKTIGKPYLCRIVSYDGIIQPSRYYASCGGIFKDMMCHDLDSLYYVLSNCYFNDKYKTLPSELNRGHGSGGKIEYVSTHGSVNIDDGFKAFNDVDTAVVLVKFRNGCIGIVENCRYAIYGHDTRAEILGCHGRIECGPNYRNTVQVANENGFKTSHKLKAHIERYQYTFALEMKAFMDDVRNKRDEISTQAAGLEDGVWNLLLIKACEVSHRCHGARVEMPSSIETAANWQFKPEINTTASKL